MVDPWSSDPWVAQARHGCGSDAEDEESYENISPEDASEQLGNYLVFLKRSGTLSAKQTCVLAFWAAAAGVKGLVESLAVPPDGDHFSRTFDNAVKVDHAGACDRYEALIPCHNRADHSQGAEWVPMALPLDCVRLEVDNDAALPEKLIAAAADFL